MKNLYGVIDIGGTNIRLAIFDNEKQVDFKKVNTPENIDDAINEIKNFYDGHDIKGIGMGMPGPADYEKGLFLDPPNLLKWHNINIFKLITEATGIKDIKAENDANLMALAYHHKLKKGKKDVTQFITVSTGLGTGLVIKDEIFIGSTGKAMEVAMVPSSPSNVENRLGPNALEYFASGSGLADQASKIGLKSTQELFDSKKPEAKAIIKNGEETLGNFVATLLAVINPNTLIFDGSVSQYQPEYIKNAMNYAKQRATPHHNDALTWLIGDLGDNAVLIGALHLIRGRNE